MSSELLIAGKTQSRAWLLGKFSRSVMSTPDPHAAGDPSDLNPRGSGGTGKMSLVPAF